LTPRTTHPLRVAFAGDVVLAGDDPVSHPDFGRQDFDLFFGNLEGIPSMIEPGNRSRFDFRFPAEKIALLRKHRFSAVSLANNHALDAGPEGLLDGMRALRGRRFPFVGAGVDEREACRPWMVEPYGTKVALYGISIVGDGAAGPGSPGIAMLPQHSRLLEDSLRTSKQAGARIIILLHGGDEYSTKVKDDQRRWARWLIARGASIIAGSHPHVIQREEVHGGSVVLHSLGNAIYPKHLKGADSGKIRLLPLTSPDP
ncbi:MAG: CapA family protein, partial [Verrucomicrobiaceae bacterium]